MPPVTANTNDKFEVVVVSELEQQEFNNVLYFQAAAPIDDVELRLILALWECFVTNLIPVMPSAWHLKHFKWKQVNPVLGIEHITIPEGQLSGAVNTPTLPTFASVVISKRTPFGGKRNRGRMYLGAIPESATSGSSLDTGSAYWQAIVAFLTCVVTKFVLGDPPGANSFQIMNYSRKDGGTTFPLGNAGFKSITSLTASTLIGTTRSRKVGRGS